MVIENPCPLCLLPSFGPLFHMTALMSNLCPVPWDRVLPRPPALHYDEHQRPSLPSPAASNDFSQHERRGSGFFSTTSSAPHPYPIAPSASAAVSPGSNLPTPAASVIGFEDPFNKARRSTITIDTTRSLSGRERDQLPSPPNPVQQASLAPAAPLYSRAASVDLNKGTHYTHTRSSSGPFPTPSHPHHLQQQLPLSRSPSRKRNASLMASGGDHSPISRDPSPGTTASTHTSHTGATSVASDHQPATGGPAHFCLCRTDPKIPRPRNGMYLTCFTLLISLCCTVFFIRTAGMAKGAYNVIGLRSVA